MSSLRRERQGEHLGHAEGFKCWKSHKVLFSIPESPNLVCCKAGFLEKKSNHVSPFHWSSMKYTE